MDLLSKSLFKLHGVTFQKKAVLILNPALLPSRLAFPLTRNLLIQLS